MYCSERISCADNGSIASYGYKKRSKSNYTSTQYYYDKFNQLTRENNPRLNKTYTYDYDANGNILAKKEYSCTSGTLGIATTRRYIYDSNYKDRLVSYGNESCAYDTAGNPTVYRGQRMTWGKGRLLTGYGNGRTISYNSNNRIIRQSLGNGIYLNNQWDGDRLLRRYQESASGITNDFVFLYGADGLIGFKYNDNTEQCYSYLKNASGDIIGILNYNYQSIASYAYDAWGNCTVYDIDDNIDTDINSLGNLNPMRYRGYYYDSDLGMYYLLSRYYDPEVGRFISPDDISYLDPESINGLNLYAYCANNPVMCTKRGGSCGSVGTTRSAGGNGVGTQSAHASPEWLKIGIGAISDVIQGFQYLLAKGIHNKFVYSTDTLYMFPELGANWSRFKIAKTGYGKSASASFKQIVNGNARAGFGAIAKSLGKTALLTGFINLGFNLLENGFDFTDGDMWIDTAIDTGIGLVAYGLAAGTASLAVAGLAMAGLAIPGFAVVVGIIGLSIFFDGTIREIAGYRN